MGRDLQGETLEADSSAPEERPDKHRGGRRFDSCSAYQVLKYPLEVSGPTMQFRPVRFFLTLMLAISLAGCGLVKNSTTPKTPPTVTTIDVSPQNSAVQTGHTLQLTATATLSDGTKSDISSTASWASSDTALATVKGGMVSGVNPGVVQIAVGSGSVSVVTLINVTTRSFSNASLSGRYAFALTSNTGRGLQTETGSLAADGNGNLIGTEEVNAAGAVTTNVSVSGTYSITRDGRGTLTVNSSGLAGRTFRLVLSANSMAAGDNNGGLVEFDGAATATGTLTHQDTSAFQNSALSAGTYVFRLGGLDSNHNPNASVGFFTTDAAGFSITGGQEDINDNGTINGASSPSPPFAVTGGTIGAVDSSSGRTNLTLTANGHTSNLVAYVISASQLQIIGVDSSSLEAGVAEKQASPPPTSLAAGGYVFQTEIGGTAGQFWIMGQFQLDNTSHVVSLAQYQDGNITLNIVNPAGTVSVGASGRGTLVENTDHGARTFTLYLVSATHIYLLETDNADAAAGAGDMQQPGPDGFGAASLNTAVAIAGAEVGDGNVGLVAAIVADGTGNLTGIEDVSQPQPGNPAKLTTSTIPFIAKYGLPSSNGVAVANLSTSNTSLQALALFFISPNRALVVGLLPNDVTGTVTLQ